MFLDDKGGTIGSRLDAVTYEYFGSNSLDNSDRKFIETKLKAIIKSKQSKEVKNDAQKETEKLLMDVDAAAAAHKQKWMVGSYYAKDELITKFKGVLSLENGDPQKALVMHYFPSKYDANMMEQEPD